MSTVDKVTELLLARPQNALAPNNAPRGGTPPVSGGSIVDRIGQEAQAQPRGVNAFANNQSGFMRPDAAGVMMTGGGAGAGALNPIDFDGDGKKSAKERAMTAALYGGGAYAINRGVHGLDRLGRAPQGAATEFRVRPGESGSSRIQFRAGGERWDTLPTGFGSEAEAMAQVQRLQAGKPLQADAIYGPPKDEFEAMFRNWWEQTQGTTAPRFAEAMKNNDGLVQKAILEMDPSGQAFAGFLKKYMPDEWAQYMEAGGGADGKSFAEAVAKSLGNLNRELDSMMRPSGSKAGRDFNLEAWSPAKPKAGPGGNSIHADIMANQMKPRPPSFTGGPLSQMRKDLAENAPPIPGQTSRSAATLDVSQRGDTLTINMIKVPEGLRGTGEASKAVDDILRRADAEGLTVFLTADPVGSGGLSKSKLEAFYKRRGFIPNTGKNKDFRVQAGMVRHPKRPTSIGQKPIKEKPGPGGNGIHASFLENQMKPRPPSFTGGPLAPMRNALANNSPPIPGRKPPRLMKDVPVATRKPGQRPDISGTIARGHEQASGIPIAKAIGGENMAYQTAKREAEEMASRNVGLEEIQRRTGLVPISYRGQTVWRGVDEGITPYEANQLFYEALRLPPGERAQWVQDILNEVGPKIDTLELGGKRAPLQLGSQRTPMVKPGKNALSGK
jgi:predicted GNAT family acetyltransferase